VRRLVRLPSPGGLFWSGESPNSASNPLFEHDWNRFERFTRSHVHYAGGDTMTVLREQEIERRLEQSRRLLQGTVDPTTTERIGRLIGELEQEKRLDKEK
jgi:hypothetical protein